jgi:spore coat protein U-like protein
MKKELHKTKSVFVKKSKMSLAKTTASLTCLIGTMLLSQNPGTAATATGEFVVNASVASTCTVSVPTMAFLTSYANSTITADALVTANCTNLTPYNITISEAFDTGSVYYLLRTGGGGAAVAADRLEITFSKVGGLAMPTATISGTGNGLDQTPGTIRGSIALNQTGKTAGTFTKSMDVTITY